MERKRSGPLWTRVLDVYICNPVNFTCCLNRQSIFKYCLFSPGERFPCRGEGALSLVPLWKPRREISKRAGGTEAITATSSCSSVNHTHTEDKSKRCCESVVQPLVASKQTLIQIYLSCKNLFEDFLPYFSPSHFRRFSSSSELVRLYVWAYANAKLPQTLKEKLHPSTSSVCFIYWN